MYIGPIENFFTSTGSSGYVSAPDPDANVLSLAASAEPPVESGIPPFPGSLVGPFESGTIPARGSLIGPQG